MRNKIQEVLSAVSIFLFFICNTQFLYSQKNAGQNPGLMNLNISPAPLTVEDKKILLSFYIGNNGNGIIDGAQPNSKVEFEVALSGLKLIGEANYAASFSGNVLEYFDVKYDADKRMVIGLQKTGAKINSFQMLLLGIACEPLKETGKSIGTDIKLILKGGIDDITIVDNTISSFTYIIDKPILGGNKFLQINDLDKKIIIKQYLDRTNKPIAEGLYLDHDTIQVDFYDNAQVDGDSISIFFNKELIAAKQKLSAVALHFNLVIDNSKEVNELNMFANNLGTIPPNTALMLVTDGEKRYKVYLSSTLDDNATIKLIPKKK